MKPELSAALAAVTMTAAAHAQALRDLFALSGLSMGTTPDRLISEAKSIVYSVSRSIAESERPKGPEVRIVYVKAGRVVCDAGTTEIVRTTPKRAMSGRGLTYDLATGIEVKAGGFYSRKRCIHPDDLAAVRAMKAGPNDVSKAIDAMKKVGVTRG